MKYSIKLDPEKTAKAYGRELHCSPKFSQNIASFIQGMSIDKAKHFLEDVIQLKRALPLKTHNRLCAHKKGGIGPGRYPKNACGYFLNIIKNAENNAEYKGLNPENMYIVHISAYKGRVIKGSMPRAMGRATPWNEQTTNIEIVIAEREEE